MCGCGSTLDWEWDEIEGEVDDDEAEEEGIDVTEEFALIEEEVSVDAES